MPLVIEEPVATDAADDVLGRVPSVLRQADLALLAVKERPLRAIGMSSSLYAVLMHLDVAPGLTGAELARAVRVTPQAIAPLVGKLVDRGLVERRQHPRHGNVQELHLTDDGRHERRRAERIVSDLDLHLRRSLGDDDYRQLRDLLVQVVDHVQLWRAPADGRP